MPPAAHGVLETQFLYWTSIKDEFMPTLREKVAVFHLLFLKSLEICSLLVCFCVTLCVLASVYKLFWEFHIDLECELA